MNEYTHLDLFSGLGSWAIAARANGIRTIGFCDREEWLAAGLERIWKVPCHREIEKFPAQEYANRVWLLTGSPPCQPASLAGKRRGKADDRWLWPQTVEVCKVVQPAWFVFENPPGIDGVGLDGIISDLERLGYEVATLRIPACAVDSAQDRDRFWIVGNRRGERLSERSLQPGISGREGCANAGKTVELGVAGGTVANGERNGVRTGLCEGEPGGIGRGRFSNSASESDCEWLPFNGRLYRVPTGLHELAVQFAAGIPKKFRGRLISALGNAIHWQVAANIIGAIKTASLTP